MAGYMAFDQGDRRAMNDLQGPNETARCEWESGDGCEGVCVRGKFASRQRKKSHRMGGDRRRESRAGLRPACNNSEKKRNL